MKQKRYKRSYRIFAAFLCVCMLLTLSGVSEMAPMAMTGQEALAAAEHSHCACGGGVTTGGHEHDTGVAWTEWTSTDSLPSEAGNYYLTKDVTTRVRWNIKADIKLCLNGHTVSCTTSDQNCVYIEGGSLSLCDCQDTGSLDLTSQYRGVYGSKGIGVREKGTFFLYSGSITATSEEEGNNFGVIVNYDRNGSMYLYGGSMTANASRQIVFVVVNQGGESCIYGGTYTAKGKEGGDDSGLSDAGLAVNSYNTYLVGNPSFSPAKVYLSNGGLRVKKDSLTYTGAEMDVTADSHYCGLAVGYLDDGTRSKFHVTSKNEDYKVIQYPIIEDVEYILVEAPNTISYNANGGTGEMEPQTYYWYGEDAQLTKAVLSKNTFTRSGYVFDGWNTRANGTGTSYADEADVVKELGYSDRKPTLYAQWSAEDYAVTLHGNGGSGTNLTSYTYETGAPLPTDWTKKGCRFDGWYASEDCKGEPVTAISETDMGKKEYWAKWTAIDYTITYELNGGTVSGTNPTAYTVESNAIVLINPTRSGYTFQGWSGTGLTGSSNKNVTIPKGSTENRTYTANWTANTVGVTVNLKKDGSGWSGQSVALRTSSTGTANAYVLSGTSSKYTVSIPQDGKTYYVFVNGSYVNQSFTAAKTNANSTKTCDVLYYTVSFDYQGATGGNTAGDRVLLSGSGYGALPTPVKTGYTFDGWYTAKSGGDEVTASTKVTEKHTVYAKWTDKEPPVIGTLEYSYELKHIWQQLIGSQSLTITVPVTEEGSGADEISYTATPEGGAPSTNTAELKNGKARITVPPDFKGTITVSCTDRAGNAAAPVTVGKECNATGILLENHAPQIAFEMKNGELASDAYLTVPDIAVTVADDKDTRVSSGIASVSYRIGNGSEKTVEQDYTKSLLTRTAFTIPASELSVGENVISVTAADHAGIVTTETKTVKVHDFSGGYQSDANGHWLECVNCGVRQKEGRHVYDDNTDTSCNECGYVRIINPVTITAYKDGAEWTDCPAAYQLTSDDGATFVTDLIAVPDGTYKIYDGATDTGETVTVEGLGTVARIDYYTVTFYDGTAVLAEPAQQIVLKNAAAVTSADIPVKTGYTFDKWVTEQGGDTEFDFAAPITGPTSVYISWKPNTYTVTLHLGGGSGGTNLISYTYGTGAALPTDWARKGYHFGGWYADADFGGTAVTGISNTDSGNKEYWAKWVDDIAPVIGDLEYSYKPKNLWQWLIGKDSLVITVPVTEEGSGADEIAYAVTTEGGSKAAKTAAIKDGAAKITVSPDFKGTITVSCTDKAANTSADVTVGTDHATGIIIEDNAPQITFEAKNATLLSTGEYETVPDIAVTVTDDKDNAVSAGIASINWQIGDGSRKAVEKDYTKSLLTGDVFTISADELLAGGVSAEELSAGGAAISVTAADHAGNSVTKKQIIKVHSHDFDGKYLFDENGHWKKCSRCVETMAKKEHIFDNENDSSCNECAYVRTIQEPQLPEPDESDNPMPDKPEPDESDNPTSQPPEPDKSDKPQPTTKPKDTPDTPGLVQPTIQSDESDTTTPEQAEKTPDTQQSKKADNHVIPAVLTDGRIVLPGAQTATGNVKGMENTSTVLKLENGAVIVTVVCEEGEYKAGVTDTAAVANAVLEPKQLELVKKGETVEIRIDVKDISDQVPERDSQVIESGIEEFRKENPNLTLGMYVDISMFIRVGNEDWNTITEAKEPIDVVIGIPEALQEKGREYYIIRAHEGEYTFLDDMDDEQETITISTDRFSSYAIAYVQKDGKGEKCGLCHICPTFLGICCFIWLAILIAAVLIIWLVIHERRKKEKEREKQR